MSDHDHALATAEFAGPTTDELDRALARSVQRGRRLVLRRNRRRAAFGGLGIVALLGGGFGVLHSLSDDGAPVDVTPAVGGTSVERSTTTTATTTTTTPVAPAVFRRTDLPNGDVRLDNTTPPPAPNGGMPTTTSPAGIDIGTAASEVHAEVTGSVRTGDHSLRITFECDPTAPYVEHITYRLVGSVVQVEVLTAGVHLHTTCADGAAVELQFPDVVVPADVRAESAYLRE